MVQITIWYNKYNYTLKSMNGTCVVPVFRFNFLPNKHGNLDLIMLFYAANMWYGAVTLLSAQKENEYPK